MKFDSFSFKKPNCTNASKLVLPNYDLAGFISSRKYGLATFVHQDLRWTHEGESPNNLDVYWLHIKMDDTSIINVYKPPPFKKTIASLSVFQPPSKHVDDFNCQHTSWGYRNNSGSGNCLIQWANLNDLSLLYNPKEPRSFH